jgi:hypothetical protein
MEQHNVPDAVLDIHDLRRLALDAEVDFRTLDRALSGRAVKALCLRRIRRVLARAGLLALLPAQPAYGVPQFGAR